MFFFFRSKNYPELLPGLFSYLETLVGDDTFRANVTRNDGQSVIDSANQLDNKYKKLGLRVIGAFCNKASELRSQRVYDQYDLALIIDKIYVGRMGCDQLVM